jgi:hypothetical protein
MVDVGTAEGRLDLLVRRAAGDLLRNARAGVPELARGARGGIRTPRSYGCLEYLAGRESFVVEWLEGETIGTDPYDASLAVRVCLTKRK